MASLLPEFRCCQFLQQATAILFLDTESKNYLYPPFYYAIACYADSYGSRTGSKVHHQHIEFCYLS
jgi:hypothetical protein